jgi:quinol monooxygenase YgiN
LTYIRLSVARPRTGETSEHLQALFRELGQLTSGQEGCLQSYLLKPHDDSGEIARIVMYTDEKAAERAAGEESIMALRSQLDLIIDPHSHRERAFFTID